MPMKSSIAVAFIHLTVVLEDWRRQLTHLRRILTQNDANTLKMKQAHEGRESRAQAHVFVAILTPYLASTKLWDIYTERGTSSNSGLC